MSKYKTPAKHKGKGIGSDYWEEEIKKKFGQVFQILLKTYKLGYEEGKKDERREETNKDS